MPTWREDTIQALKNLGGVAHLSEIHKEVEKLRKGKLNNTWTQTVQRELETYSSDSKAFGGGKDIFYITNYIPGTVMMQMPGRRCWIDLRRSLLDFQKETPNG